MWDLKCLNKVIVSYRRIGLAGDVTRQKLLYVKYCNALLGESVGAYHLTKTPGNLMEQ